MIELKCYPDIFIVYIIGRSTLLAGLLAFNKRA